MTEEAKHLKEDIHKLQLQVEKQKKSKLEAEKLAKEKKLLRRGRLEKQKADLLNQSKALQSPPKVQQGFSQPSANVGVANSLKVKAAELKA
jgi:hypothetical protein